MTERTNAVFRDTDSKAVIASILAVAFPDIKSVADLTYGKGAFWYGPPDSTDSPLYHAGVRLVGFDKRPRYGCQIAADARYVPLADEAVDVVIFDPPHQHAISKTTTLRHQADFDRMPNQKDIHQLLREAAPELRRVARIGAIVKLTDMVEAGRFMPTHAMFSAAAAPLLGWPCDLAILDSGVVRPMKPNQRVLHLRHAHSYFLCYRWSEREPRSPFWEVENRPRSSRSAS